MRRTTKNILLPLIIGLTTLNINRVISKTQPKSIASTSIFNDLKGGVRGTGRSQIRCITCIAYEDDQKTWDCLYNPDRFGLTNCEKSSGCETLAHHTSSGVRSLERRCGMRPIDGYKIWCRSLNILEGGWNYCSCNQEDGCNKNVNPENDWLPNDKCSVADSGDKDEDCFGPADPKPPCPNANPGPATCPPLSGCGPTPGPNCYPPCPEQPLPPNCPPPSQTNCPKLNCTDCPNGPLPSSTGQGISGGNSQPSSSWPWPSAPSTGWPWPSSPSTGWPGPGPWPWPPSDDNQIHWQKPNDWNPWAPGPDQRPLPPLPRPAENAYPAIPAWSASYDNDHQQQEEQGDEPEWTRRRRQSQPKSFNKWWHPPINSHNLWPPSSGSSSWSTSQNVYPPGPTSGGNSQGPPPWWWCPPNHPSWGAQVAVPALSPEDCAPQFLVEPLKLPLIWKLGKQTEFGSLKGCCCGNPDRETYNCKNFPRRHF